MSQIKPEDEFLKTLKNHNILILDELIGLLKERGDKDLVKEAEALRKIMVRMDKSEEELMKYIDKLNSLESNIKSKRLSEEN